MNTNKGFMNSLITILITALLIELIFSFQYSSAQIARAQQSISAIEYANYYFDDIAYDLTRLSSDNLILYRINATYVGLTFIASENVSNFSAIIANYTQKLQQQARNFNGNFTIDTSNISSNGTTYYFSNGVIFTSGYNSSEKSKLLSSPNATFKNYTISFLTNQVRVNLSDFNYSGLPGDCYVKLNITDANGTYLSEGFIPTNGNKVLEVNYTTSFFKVFIKKIDDNDNSFYVLKGDIPNSTLTVNVIIENDGVYPVYITIPVYLNITTLGYSKYGVLVPLKV